MTRYKLKVTLIGGEQSVLLPEFLTRQIAERNAKRWREVSLMSRVEVVKANAV